MNDLFRPDAYLIVRPSDGPELASLGVQGFRLVGVQRRGDAFATADGAAIQVSDNSRFLYRIDADRAIARGIASDRDGVLVGVRYPALAVFPHLRARHVPDSAGSAAPIQNATDISVEGSVEMAESLVTGVDSEPDVQDAEIDQNPSDPADAPKPLELVEEDEETGKSVSVDESRQDFVSEGDLEVDIAGDDEWSPDEMADVLARVSDALERGEVPMEPDLEDLSRDPAAMALVLERSVDLAAECQMELADMAVFLLAATDDRSLMYRWLVTAEERLIGRSNLLVQLIHTWLEVDGRGALGELRKLLQMGAVSLKQRKPVEVASLLRDAARVVGDADSLREAYESLTQAPSRMSDSRGLRTLLRELEDEEGPTQAELRAIGLPIMLQAFRSSTDDDLAELATDAERYVRGYLRSDPPNLESARLLEAVLLKAHDRVEANQKPSIENTLRELRQAQGGPPTIGAPTATSIVLTYEELLATFDGRSDNFEILARAYESARAWGKDGIEYLQALRDALEASAVVADRFAAQEFGPDGFVGAFADAGQVLIPGESDTAGRHRRTVKDHLVRNRLGELIKLGPHLKFGQGYRLYLAFDRQRRVIYVGQIGDHLPGKKSKDRPRR